MQLLKQFNGELPKKTAWTLLTELEQGFSPAFYFSDWYSPYDKVVAQLNPVQFVDSFNQFNQCIAGLLPYSFDDIAFTVLSYETGGDKLTRESERRLEQIAQYLKYDPEIDYVEIQGYTDSYGGRWPNQKLSEKRADAIKQVFVDLGIEEGKISVEGHGEKQHVASNETDTGRAKNRRVVINMGRNGTI